MTSTSYHAFEDAACEAKDPIKLNKKEITSSQREAIVSHLRKLRSNRRICSSEKLKKKFDQFARDPASLLYLTR